MRGYINLDKDDDHEYGFTIDFEKGEQKHIWIEYLGMFDGMGGRVGENKLRGIVPTETSPRTSTKKTRGTCGERRTCGDNVVDTTVSSRMDIVI